MAKQLNVNLAFNADTSKAQAALKELQKSLQDIAKIPGKASTLFDDKEIKEASKAALELQQHLSAAMNPKTGNLDLSRLSTSLKTAGKDLNTYYNQLAKIGPEGTKTFMDLARAVSLAEAPVVRINSKLMELGTVLKNTAKWQISSSVLHGFMGTIQGAYRYAQDLNESLNNIRIVTGQSTEEMAKFAAQANKSAKALSTSTTAYTDAALIFYQQGLSGDAVTERTDTVIKMSNVTKQSAEEVSSYMTAIWNNFDDGSESLEHYADVITALGATTASSSAEIAEGLEKFASVADTIGLSYDYATSILSALVANTRQSADVIGTSLKTILARLQSVKLGETLDDGVELTKYTSALNAIGVSVLDLNGNLRDADDILDDTAAKWDTLNKAQQAAVAQTVAGTRQYSQFIAMMENWGDVEKNLQTAQGADGTLQDQADIYAESWEAASDRVKAAAQSIYQDLLDDEFFIKVTNTVEKFLEIIDKLIDNLGGLKGVLFAIGSMFLTTYAQKMPAALDTLKQNFYVFTGQASKAMLDFKNKVSEKVAEIRMDPTTSLGYKVEAEGIERVIEMQNKLALSSKNMTEEEQEAYKRKIENVQAMYEETKAIAEETEELEKNAKAKKAAATEKAKTETSSLIGRYNEAESKKTSIEQQITEKERTLNRKKYKDKAPKKEKLSDHGYKKAMKRYEEAQVLKKEIEDLKAEYEEATQAAEELEEQLSNVETAFKINIDSSKNRGEQVKEAVSQQMDEYEEKLIASKSLEAMSTGAKGQSKEWQKQTNELENGDKALKKIVLSMKAFLSAQKDIAKKNGIPKVIEEIEKLEQECENLNSESVKDVQNFAKTIDDVFDIDTEGTFKNVADEYDGIFNDMDEKTSVFGEATQQAFEEAKGATEGYIESQEKVSEALNNAGEAAEEEVESQFHLSTAMTQFASAATATFAVCTSLKNAFNTMQDAMDGNASAIDVLGAGFAVLTTVVGAFSSVMALSDTLMKNNVVSTLANAAAEKILSNAKIADTLATLGLEAACVPLLVITLALMAALAALALIIWGVVAAIKAYQANTPEAKLAALKDEAEKSAEACDRVKTAIDGIKDSLDSLVKSYETISKLKQGTTEWYQEIVNTNYEVAKLIEQYEGLSKYVANENGVLKLSQEGIDYINKQNEKILNAATNKKITDEIKVNQQTLKMRYEEMQDIGYQSSQGTGPKSLARLDAYDNTYIDDSIYDGFWAGVSEYYGYVGDTLFDSAINEDLIAAYVDGFLPSQEEYEKAGNTDYEKYRKEQIKSLKGYVEANEEYIKKTKELVDSTQAMMDSQLEVQIQSTNTLRDINDVKNLYGPEDPYNAIKATTREDLEQNFQWRKNKNNSYTEADEEWKYIQDFIKLQGGIDSDVSYLQQKNGKLVLSVGGKEEEFTKDEVLDTLAEYYSQDNFKEDFAKKIREDLEETFSNIDSSKFDKLEADDIINIDNLHLLFQQAFSGIDSSAADELFERILIDSEMSTEQIKEFSEAIGNINWNDIDNKRVFNKLAQDLKEGNIELDEFKQGIDKLSAEADLDNMSGFFTSAASDLGLKEDDAAMMQEYARNLMEIAEESDQLGDNLAYSAESAADLAVEIYRMNKGIDALSDGFEEWSDVIKKSSNTSQEYAEAMYYTKQALSDILDIESEYMSSDFIENHLQEIGKAAEGDAEAIESLKAAMSDEIIQHITVDKSDVEIGEIKSLNEEIQSIVDDIEINGIEIGAEFDDSAFITAANELVEKANMTADEANAYFASIGYEPLAYEEDVDASTELPNGETVTTADFSKKQRIKITGAKGLLGNIYPEQGIEFPMPTITTESIDNGSTTVEGSHKLVAFSGGKKAPTIRKMKKKATGSFNNKSKANAGGKSGKSSGGSSNGPKTKDAVNKFDPDPFHKVNQELEDVAHTLNKLDKKQSHLFGADLIKNLEKQNELLKEQMELHKEKMEIAQKEADLLQEQLLTQGVNFEGDNIANYNEVLQAAEDQINALITQYNALSAAEQEAWDNAGSNNPITQAEKYYDTLKDRLDKYSDYMSTVYSEEESALEDLYKQIENNLKAYDVKIQLELDITDAQRLLRKFLKDINTDIKNLRKTTQEWAEEFVTAVSDADSYKTDAGTNLNKLNEYKDAAVGGERDLFATESEKVQAIIELERNLLNDSENLLSAYKEAYSSLESAFSDVAAEFDEIIDQFNTIDSTLDHYAKVIELLYGGGETDTGREQLAEVYEAQRQNSLNRQDALRQYKAQLEARKAEALASGYDEDDSYIKNIDAEIKETSAELESTIENYIDIIQRELENSIKIAQSAMDKGIFGASTEDIQQQWDDKKAQAEGYYDTVERIYQLESLESKWKAAITSAGSLKAQQQLADLMEKQVESLENKTVLSEKDVELAEKELAVYQAQIALEEAQNNKNSMKLARDASGNWSYQYVADEQDVAAKQEDYLNKVNDWRTASINAAEEIAERVTESYERYSERLSELMNNVALSDTERAEKVAELNETYWGEEGIITRLVEDSNFVQETANRATYIELESLYIADENNLRRMTENEQNLVQTMNENNLNSYSALRNFVVGEDGNSGLYGDIENRCNEVNLASSVAWDSMAANAIAKMYEDPGSVKNMTEQAYSDMTTALDNYTIAIQESVKNSGIQWNNAKEQVKEVKDQIDGSTDSLNDFFKKMSQLGEYEGAVLKIKSAWEGVSGQIKQATSDLEAQYEELKRVHELEEQAAKTSKAGNMSGGFSTNTNLGSAASSGSGSLNGGSNGGDTPNSTTVTKPTGSDTRSNDYNPPSNAKYVVVYKEGKTAKAGTYPVDSIISNMKDGNQYDYEFLDKNGNIIKLSKNSTYGGNTASHLAAFDTGGYTGEWDGGEGRMAMLHSKELVLNATDTENILAAVNSIRQIASIGSSITESIASGISSMIMDLMGLKSAEPGSMNTTNDNSNQNNVYNINAEFPNATSVDDIKEAILSLPNYVSQFKMRK